MPTFFKPLRRKIGVITLGLACMFAGLWVRSCFMDDRVILELKNGDICARSNWKSLLISRGQLVVGLSNPGTPKWKCLTNPTKNDHRTPLPETHWFNVEGLDIAWRKDALGFHAGRVEYVVERRPVTWAYYVIMPYWSLVIPLTLLSARLLLSKPPAKPVTPIGSQQT